MTRGNKRLLGMIVAAGVAALIPARAAGPVALRLRFQSGNTYRIRMTSDQAIHQTYKGRSLDTT